MRVLPQTNVQTGKRVNRTKCTKRTNRYMTGFDHFNHLLRLSLCTSIRGSAFVSINGAFCIEIALTNTTTAL